jgi:hypothetical protein
MLQTRLDDGYPQYHSVDIKRLTAPGNGILIKLSQ